MKSIAGCVLALILATGCVRNPIGPRTIPTARIDYNAAISRSWDEDLLLNVVRLQYRDSPLFVDVSSVTASYGLGRTASVGVTKGGGIPADVIVGAGLSFSENPVIGYTYLHGEAFARGLLSPLAPAVLEELAQSGWSIERLLLCCVQSINGIQNAVAAAGPTPTFVPEYETFHRVAALFRRLQLAGHVIAEQQADGRMVVYLKARVGPEGDEVRSLLSLDRDAERFEVLPSRRAQLPTQIAIQGRSLLAVMSFLSQAVEVPKVHRDAGKVTVTRDAAGNEFDWARIVGPLMRIHSGTSRPDQAAVRVEFRDHWFWIDDNDLNSKTTFALLRLLLFLKSGESQGASPLVTIPVR